MNSKIINLFFLFILFTTIAAPNVCAANIHGKIYSFDLQKLNDVIIEINSTPKQTFVSKDGEYSFDVNKGKYLLKAMRKIGPNLEKTEEIIIITEENGDFNIDLFLMTELEDENIIDFETELDKLSKEDYKINVTRNIIILSSIIILGIFILFFILKNKSKNKKIPKNNKELEYNKNNSKETDLKKIILDAIKIDGRTTQKELRKIIPYSESKISLVLTELESEGKIKKIKKGRGNIITIN